MNRLLERHYYNLNYPESYTTKTALEKRFKGEVSKKDIDEWSQAQNTLTEYSPARKNFLRRPTLAHKKDAVWAMDTAFFIPMAKYNRGYKYLVIIVDVLTKYVRGVPLKTKKPSELVQGIKKIFKKVKPMAAYTDLGGEYFKEFDKYLKENNIQHWKAMNETKSSEAERAILTYKLRLYRYLQHNTTKKWIDVYEKILDNINNSYNRSIKMAPAQCVTEEQQRQAFINQYANKIGFIVKDDELGVGQKVKISHLRVPFRKAFNRNFSESVYTLVKKFPKENQNVYSLKASDGEIITGKFYRKEFKKTRDENNSKVK